MSGIDEEYRTGRNLIAAAFALLVYNLSGAHFTGEVYIFGGGVTVEHPKYLSYAGLTVYAFFFYHFVRTHTNGIWGTAARIRERFHQDRFLKKHLTKRARIELDRRSQEGDEGQVDLRTLDWKGSSSTALISREEIRAQFPPKSIPAEHDEKWPYRMDWTKNGLKAVSAVSALERTEGGIILPINPATAALAGARAAFMVIARDDEFWQNLFPLVFALAVGEWVFLRWLFAP